MERSKSSGAITPEREAHIKALIKGHEHLLIAIGKL